MYIITVIVGRIKYTQVATAANQLGCLLTEDRLSGGAQLQVTLWNSVGLLTLIQLPVLAPFLKKINLLLVCAKSNTDIPVSCNSSRAMDSGMPRCQQKVNRFCVGATEKLSNFLSVFVWRAPPQNQVHTNRLIISTSNRAAPQNYISPRGAPLVCCNTLYKQIALSDAR
jgi:hypothetical protein